MVLKVTLIGHSYVRRLMEYRVAYEESPFSMSVDGVEMRLSFVHQGGCGYEFFKHSEPHKAEIVRSCPDIILVILGGNGVSSEAAIPTVSTQMRKFHEWLRLACPSAIIIAAECEPRYNLNMCDHKGNPVESYRLRRNAFNQAIKRMNRLKDYIFRTANYLNHREFYGRNGIHLNSRGNRFYWGMIRDCLGKVIDKFDIRQD